MTERQCFASEVEEMFHNAQLRLHEAISTLENRLHPISIPSRPKVSAGEEKEKENEMPKYFRRLNESAESVRVACDRLDDIIIRLEV